ncbi:zinc finger BED domain-containing protein 1-like [Agrilus planipennis]|uniref:Zinc finger BED domain-containing protein 1-like n=1 Tax=Agrilus planipennis TaxID=224129 RepID=A0A1W4XFU6_AGRPL|nr:zinc finger BED domain-containing protein 1-like [Agrilus planipennis]
MKRGPKTSSTVWEHFKRSGEKKNNVTCSICKNEFKYSGNTSNLREHLKRKHPASLFPQREPEEDADENVVTSVVDPSQEIDSSSHNSRRLFPGGSAVPIPIPTNITAKNQGKPLSKSKGSRQLRLFGSTRGDGLTPEMKDKLDKALLQMIVIDYQPLSIVENKGFINYSNNLNPHYQLPTRKLLTSVWLENLYQEESRKIKTILTDVANVAVTTDIWTSDSNKAYISVTIHFVYNNQMVSRNIATNELEDVHHTGENIARALNSIFQEWNINNKIVTVVSDNGANIKNTIRQINVHHHPCIAHTLNLTVNESLDDIPLLNTVIKKYRSLVGHFKHSVVASQILKEMQIQMNLPILKVKQDIRTRWNSCLIMMERLLKIKAPLSAAITSIPQAPEFLDTAEWQIIADCVSLLKPTEDITTVLSGEKYPTLSMVPPLIKGLQL